MHNRARGDPLPLLKEPGKKGQAGRLEVSRDDSARSLGGKQKLGGPEGHSPESVLMDSRSRMSSRSMGCFVTPPSGGSSVISPMELLGLGLCSPPGSDLNNRAGCASSSQLTQCSTASSPAQPSSFRSAAIDHDHAAASLAGLVQEVPEPLATYDGASEGSVLLLRQLLQEEMARDGLPGDDLDVPPTMAEEEADAAAIMGSGLAPVHEELEEPTDLQRQTALAAQAAAYQTPAPAVRRTVRIKISGIDPHQLTSADAMHRLHAALASRLPAWMLVGACVRAGSIELVLDLLGPVQEGGQGAAGEGAAAGEQPVEEVVEIELTPAALQQLQERQDRAAAAPGANTEDGSGSGTGTASSSTSSSSNSSSTEQALVDALAHLGSAEWAESLGVEPASLGSSTHLTTMVEPIGSPSACLQHPAPQREQQKGEAEGTHAAAAATQANYTCLPLSQRPVRLVCASPMGPVALPCPAPTPAGPVSAGGDCAGGADAAAGRSPMPLVVLLTVQTSPQGILELMSLGGAQGITLRARCQGQDVPVELLAWPAFQSHGVPPDAWIWQQESLASLFTAQMAKAVPVAPAGAKGSGSAEYVPRGAGGSPSHGSTSLLPPGPSAQERTQAMRAILHGGMAANRAAASSMPLPSRPAQVHGQATAAASTSGAAAPASPAPAPSVTGSVTTHWFVSLDMRASGALRACPTSLVIEVWAGPVLVDYQPLILLDPSSATLAPELAELAMAQWPEKTTGKSMGSGSSRRYGGGSGMARPGAAHQAGGGHAHHSATPQAQIPAELLAKYSPDAGGSGENASSGDGNSSAGAGQGVAAATGAEDSASAPLPACRDPEAPSHATTVSGTASEPLPSVTGPAAEGAAAPAAKEQQPLPQQAAAEARLLQAVGATRAFIQDLALWLELVWAREQQHVLALRFGAASAGNPQHLGALIGLDRLASASQHLRGSSPAAAAAAAMGCTLHGVAVWHAAAQPRVQARMVGLGKSLLQHATRCGLPHLATRILEGLIGPACGLCFSDVAFVASGARHGGSTGGASRAVHAQAQGGPDGAATGGRAGAGAERSSPGGPPVTLLSLAIRSHRPGMVRMVVKWGHLFGLRWGWGLRSPGGRDSTGSSASSRDSIGSRDGGSAGSSAGSRAAQVASTFASTGSASDLNLVVEGPPPYIPGPKDVGTAAPAASVAQAGNPTSTIADLAEPEAILPEAPSCKAITGTNTPAAEADAAAAVTPAPAAPASAWAQAQQLLLQLLRGFPCANMEQRYKVHMGSLHAQLVCAWALCVVAMVTLACARSLVLGEGAEELPGLVLWAAGYAVLAWATRSAGAGLPPRHAQWVEVGCGSAGACRAAACLLWGVGVLAVPESVKMVMTNNLEWTTEPFMYTPLERMRLPGLLALRTFAVVGYAALHARLGAPYPVVRALCMNLLCMAVGAWLDAQARKRFLAAEQQAKQKQVAAGASSGAGAAGSGSSGPAAAEAAVVAGVDVGTGAVAGAEGLRQRRQGMAT